MKDKKMLDREKVLEHFQSLVDYAECKPSYGDRRGRAYCSVTTQAYKKCLADLKEDFLLYEGDV